MPEPKAARIASQLFLPTTIYLAASHYCLDKAHWKRGQGCRRGQQRRLRCGKGGRCVSEAHVSSSQNWPKLVAHRGLKRGKKGTALSAKRPWVAKRKHANDALCCK